MTKDTTQDKKYYSITEVSELCDIKSHTLRFWEKEFKDLKPITRKGNRRYYQKADIDLIKKIQSLLYKDGMTCLLYTSPSPRDRSVSRMPSSA